MLFRSAFVLALIEFANESEENLAKIQDLRARAIQAALDTPDGSLVTQVSGTLNGKTTTFQVDRPLSKLIGDIGEVLRAVSGDTVKGTHFDFRDIIH